MKEVDFIIELLSYVVERIKEEADAEVKRREKDKELQFLDYELGESNNNNFKDDGDQGCAVS